MVHTQPSCVRERFWSMSHIFFTLLANPVWYKYEELMKMKGDMTLPSGLEFLWPNRVIPQF